MDDPMTAQVKRTVEAGEHIERVLTALIEDFRIKTGRHPYISMAVSFDAKSFGVHVTGSKEIES